jgi:hypothetical protein
MKASWTRPFGDPAEDLVIVGAHQARRCAVHGDEMSVAATGSHVSRSIGIVVGNDVGVARWRSNGSLTMTVSGEQCGSQPIGC